MESVSSFGRFIKREEKAFIGSWLILLLLYDAPPAICFDFDHFLRWLVICVLLKLAHKLFSNYFFLLIQSPLALFPLVQHLESALLEKRLYFLFLLFFLVLKFILGVLGLGLRLDHKSLAERVGRVESLDVEGSFLGSTLSSPAC